MDLNKRVIAIIGLGNIGKRHLQAILELDFDLTIFIVDTNANRFDEFREQFRQEIDKSDKNIDIHFSDNLMIGLNLDICIVSTPVTFRCEIINFLNTQNKVACWILEKPVANSLESLTKIASILKDCDSVYVNVPRETMESYIDFKIFFTKHVHSCRKVLITGNEWGLASNSIHFLRLLEWLSESKFLDLNFEGANYSIPTKRNDFLDLRAKLVGILDNNCNVELVDDPKFNRFEIKFDFSNFDVFIYEEEKSLIQEDSVINIFTLELQSSLTTKYVRELIVFGKCDLPLLGSILHLESMMLTALLGSMLYDDSNFVIRYT